MIKLLILMACNIYFIIFKIQKYEVYSVLYNSSLIINNIIIFFNYKYAVYLYTQYNTEYLSVSEIANCNFGVNFKYSFKQTNTKLINKKIDKHKQQLFSD